MPDTIAKPTEEPHFGRTAESYATHRLGFPASMYARLAGENILKHGMRHLDLGTGTGTIARNTAAMGLHSEGLDIDAAMLTEAERLTAEQGLDATFRVGPAEKTGVDAESLDLVTAGQCWHWFDRNAAAAEALRILKPGGHLAICHYDWLPLKGNDVEATEQLILKYAPDWQAAGGNGVYPWWFRDMAEAGFVNIQSFSYDEPAVYSHEAWVGRIEASAGIAALEPDVRVAFKAELLKVLAKYFPLNPLYVAHRVFCVWGKKSAR